MAKAKRLPSGNYRCLAYIGKDSTGKRHYESVTAETAAEAEMIAAQIRYNKKREDKAGPVQPTLAEATERYIDSKSAILSPSTIREYRRMAKNNLSGIMGLRLDELTAENLQVEFNKEALTLSPKTLRNVRGLLTAVLAVYLPTFRVTVTLPAKQKIDFHVPTSDDVVKFIHSVEGTELELAALLAAFGSLRRGEICALTVDDIKGKNVHITKAIVLDEWNQWVLKDPKTYDSNRVVAMPDAVIRKLKRVKSGNIVTRTPNRLTADFRAAFDRLGMHDFTLHTLRHYQASILHALNVPEKYVMQRGGWKSEQTMKKVYRHAMEEKMAEVDKIATQHFDKLLTGKGKQTDDNTAE